MKIMFCLFVAINLVGCQSPQRVSSPSFAGLSKPAESYEAKDLREYNARVKTHLAQHPETRQTIRECFEKRKIDVGMTKEEAIVVMGDPFSKETSGGIGPHVDVLTFDEGLSSFAYLTFHDGFLIRWSLPR